MFTDARSKKIVLVAHCILNQNAKIDACAHYPGAISEALAALHAAGVGLVQLPCPELLYLGLDRGKAAGSAATVEAEDTRVARRMGEAGARALCRQLVAGIVYQLEEYRKHGFEVAGLVGINCSPTCGVETTWSDDREHAGQGVFTKLLGDELAARGLAVKAAGIKAREPEQAVRAIAALLGG